MIIDLNEIKVDAEFATKLSKVVDEACKAGEDPNEAIETFIAEHHNTIQKGNKNECIKFI